MTDLVTDLQRVRLLLQLRRSAEALELASTLLAAHPDDADVLTVIGQASLQAGRSADALAAAERAAALAPQDAYPHLVQAGALVDLGRFGAAVEAAEWAVALAPHNPDGLRILAGVLLATPVRNPVRGRRLRQQARVAAARAVELDPTSPHNLRRLAEVERADGHPSLARDLLRRALELSPTDAPTQAEAVLASYEAQGTSPLLAADDMMNVLRAEPNDLRAQGYMSGIVAGRVWLAAILFDLGSVIVGIVAAGIVTEVTREQGDGAAWIARLTGMGLLAALGLTLALYVLWLRREEPALRRRARDELRRAWLAIPIAVSVIGFVLLAVSLLCGRPDDGAGLSLFALGAMTQILGFALFVVCRVLRQKG